MDKSNKTDSDSQPSCHHDQQKKRCQMRSAGCGHESALKAFWFDAILPDPNLTSAPFFEKNHPTKNEFGVIDLAEILTPPPRTLLL
jgi:hypothetical protein